MALRGTAVGTASPGATVSVSVAGIGIQSGDIVLLCGDFGGGAALTPTFPSGFSPISGLSNFTTDFNQTSSIAYKVAGASEPSTYTVTPGATDNHELQCRVYSGRAGTGTFTATQSSTGGFSTPPYLVSATGLTAAAADDVVIFTIAGANSSATTWTYSAGSGFANAALASTTGSFQGAVGGSDAVNVSAGATGTIGGTFTATNSPGNYYNYVMSIALGSGPGNSAPIYWVA